MTRVPRWSLVAAVVALVASTMLLAGCDAKVIDTHNVVFDGSGKIIPWNSSGSDAYDGVVRNSWNGLLNTVPTEPNGLKAYFTYSYVNADTQQPGAWPKSGQSLRNVDGISYQLVPVLGRQCATQSGSDTPRLPAGPRDDGHHRQLAIGLVRQL